MNVDEFAAYLRLNRLARKIAQGELARRIGVSQQTLCAWELGSWRPRADNLAAWATALGEQVPSTLLDECARRATCGTNGGYQAHVRKRTTPCGDCAVAHATYQASYRQRAQVPS